LDTPLLRLERAQLLTNPVPKVQPGLSLTPLPQPPAPTVASHYRRAFGHLSYDVTCSDQPFSASDPYVNIDRRSL
jgi:hypothetical protein